MSNLLTKPRCQKLSKFSTDRQTHRPTDKLPLEAPSRSLKTTFGSNLNEMGHTTCFIYTQIFLAKANKNVNLLFCMM